MVSETVRQRSARRSKIISDVYAAWVADRLADQGIRLEPELFNLEGFARRAVGAR